MLLDMCISNDGCGQTSSVLQVACVLPSTCSKTNADLHTGVRIAC
jgi:hypothetical protein